MFLSETVQNGRELGRMKRSEDQESAFAARAYELELRRSGCTRRRPTFGRSKLDPSTDLFSLWPEGGPDLESAKDQFGKRRHPGPHRLGISEENRGR